MEKTKFESFSIFSVGLHKFYEPELAKLAKKIVYENQNIFLNSEEVNNSFTNFIFQNVGKHEIDEGYKNKTDVFELKQKILQNALNVLNLYGYVSQKTKYEIINLWFNITKSGGSQGIHHHYGSVLSGAFYVNTPENSSPIIFESPIGNILPYNNIISEQKEYNIFNSRKIEIYPKAGEMYFWLSCLEHSVPAAVFDGNRIVCSFDISTTL
jgi:uncharacterized protein (TIGR02466 family)